MAKTADRLLDGIKRRIILPSSQPLLSDEDMLQVADDVIEQVIVPVLLSVRQDYLVGAPYEQAVTSGTSAYSIPYRSIGRGLRDVKMINGSDSVRNLSLLTIEQAHDYTTGTPTGFYFRGDKIVLLPEPDASDETLQIWYNVQPSRLVLLENVGTVASYTSTTVTVDAVPSSITTSTAVDFIQARSGCTLLAMDVDVTGATSTVLTFASGDIPTDLAVGDYVSLYQTTPVVPIPDEGYPLLETSAARRILNMIGDFEGANALKAEEDDAEKRFKMLIEPRVQGEPTKIVNRSGLLRGRRMNWRRGLFSE